MLPGAASARSTAQRGDQAGSRPVSTFLTHWEYCLVSGEVPGTQGRGHQRIPTYRSFICGDDIDIVTTANSENMYRSLCAVLGLPA